jgi:hypothetical protein
VLRSSRPRLFASSKYERAASIDALAFSVLVRAASAAIRVASATAAVADCGMSFIVVLDIVVSFGLLSRWHYLHVDSKCSLHLAAPPVKSRTDQGAEGIEVSHD